MASPGGILPAPFLAPAPAEIAAPPSPPAEAPRPPSPIVPTGHAVLDVSLALNAATNSYGIRINKDGAARVVVVDFSDHEVMALGAIRVGDVILSVQGFDATRESFGEVVGRIGDAKSAGATLALVIGRPRRRTPRRRDGAEPAPEPAPAPAAAAEPAKYCDKCGHLTHPGQACNLFPRAGVPVQLREYAAAAEAALGFCAEAPKRGYTRRVQPAPPAHALLAAIAEAPPPPEEEGSEDDEFGMIAASSGASTFEADRQRVLDFYSAEGTGEEGCQVGYVAGALGMDAVRLRQIVDFLESEGQLYATLNDDYHKSIYEPCDKPAPRKRGPPRARDLPAGRVRVGGDDTESDDDDDFDDARPARRAPSRAPGPGRRPPTPMEMPMDRECARERVARRRQGPLAPARGQAAPLRARGFGRPDLGAHGLGRGRALGSRDAAECRLRWEKVIGKGERKGRFTAAEDEAVRKYAAEGLEWPEIAARVPGRNSKQIRDRFYNKLAPGLKAVSDPWTEREDALLYHSYQKWGSAWGQICLVVTGRSPNMVKNRWNSQGRKERWNKRTPDVAMEAECADIVAAAEYEAPRCGTLAPRAYGAEAPTHRDPTRPIGYRHDDIKVYLKPADPSAARNIVPQVKRRKRWRRPGLHDRDLHYKPDAVGPKAPTTFKSNPVMRCALCLAEGTTCSTLPCCAAAVCAACRPDVAVVCAFCQGDTTGKGPV
ncbi:RNA polymerase II transcription regulator recruiting protein [Aureococcus anophagefferens]|nr:RNA polymerase II transcription regulator recruiting protein [Aureococcus anophagefferens]